VSELIETIKNKIDVQIKLPHQAATIAFELFLLIIRDVKSEGKVEALLNFFFEQLPIWKLENLTNIQADYAISIAAYNGKLNYEEMHKLFSLCDEIYALEYLGLKIDETKRKELEDKLRYRFSNEKRKAHVAAKQNVEFWNNGLWWYKENME